MTNRINRSLHRVGVAVAALIALAGVGWAVAAMLFPGGKAFGAILGGLGVTAVLALAAWGFYGCLGWVVAGFARD